MSIITALFGLAIAMVSAGGLGVVFGGINYLVEMDGDPHSHEVRNAKHLLLTATIILMLGGFLIGLTAQGATS